MLIPPVDTPVPDRPLRIGDVAELTGLSLRSIRHYEELGLLTASSRTAGGFRLFDAEGVRRLRLIMQLKLMDLPLESIKDLLDVYLRAVDAPADLTAEQHAQLAECRTAVDEHVANLRARADSLGQLATQLDRVLTCRPE